MTFFLQVLLRKMIDLTSRLPWLMTMLELRIPISIHPRLILMSVSRTGSELKNSKSSTTTTTISSFGGLLVYLQASKILVRTSRWRYWGKRVKLGLPLLFSCILLWKRLKVALVAIRLGKPKYIYHKLRTKSLGRCSHTSFCWLILELLLVFGIDEA